MKSTHASLSFRIRQNRHFYYFISPFFILFAVFGLYPLVYSLYLSFLRWDGLTAPQAVGFGNYANLFRDAEFLSSLWNTFLIGLYHIPPMFLFAFFFAVILNSPLLRLRGFFRAAAFIPCVTPIVVTAIVFSLLYGTEKGLLNYLITVGSALLPWGEIKPVPWLESAQWSKISVSILLVWRWTGYNMVLMLAGLQGIPDEYYEAAKIDGAGPWQRLRLITIPLMRPTFVFCAITSLIGTTYMFEEVLILTEGGPGASSTNFGYFLFNKSFVDGRFGYASTAAYTVAAGVFILSLIVLRFRKSPAD